MAIWLNTAFSGFDHALLSLYHGMAEILGGLLTPLMGLITLIGEKGLVFFLMALIFMLSANRRDLGVCIFGAVCCGALITNIILKDAIARPRPFDASTEYYEWWLFVGAPAEDGFSFPSGHVTACAAGLTAICAMKGKKFVLPSVIIVFFMGLSRNYLMAHYPTDVIAATVVGIFSGIVAWFITQLIFRFLKARSHVPLFEFALDFDLRDLLPFELPRLHDSVSVAVFREKLHQLLHRPSGKAGRAAKAAETDEDADMKTYSRGSRARTEEPAERRAARPEAEPVRRSPQSGSSAGRHAIEPAPAKKKKSISVPGAYKGKHEL